MEDTMPDATRNVGTITDIEARYTVGLRRFLAITLVLAFGFPLIASALALSGDPDSKLPICCRRSGAHHCAQSMGMLEAAGKDTRVNAPPMRCPAFPQAVSPTQHQDAAVLVASLMFAEVQSHPSVKSQTEAWVRVALEGARQKRGPPNVRIS